MKKRIFTILVALTLLISMPASMVQASATTMTAFERELLSAVGTETLAIMEAQKDAVDAYAAFCDYFRAADGTVEFPDDYGGEAVIDNVLHIYLTDISKETVARYVPAFAGYEKVVTFEKVEYSYNYLIELRDEAFAQLCDSANGGYVDVTSNRVVIEMSKNALEKNGVKSNWRTVLADKPIILSENEDVDPTATQLKGGDYLVASGGGRTLAVCGTYQNQPAILSCGHNGEYTTLASGDILRLNGSSSVAATVQTAHYTGGGAGDYSISTINASLYESSYWMKYENNQYIPVDSAVRTLPVGTYVIKYGVGSDEFATVMIATNNYTATYIDEITGFTFNIHNMVRARIETGTADDGDSGGPIFMYADGECSFVGVISGRIMSSASDSFVVYTPYDVVADIFTVHTAP